LGDELAALEVKEGSLWKKTRMLTKRREAIPPLKEGRLWITSSLEKAQLFAQILEEKFTPHSLRNGNFNQHITDTIQEPLQLTPFNTYFTPQQVFQVISTCAPEKKSRIRSYCSAFTKKIALSYCEYVSSSTITNIPFY
jgi:hypothetical protein